MPQFGVLGPLEATSDGGAVIPLAGQKQRALLALLLLNANEVVSSDRLIDQLWNEEAPATAATSLRNLITGLRKSIGHDTVSTRPPGYVLTVNPSDLDLMRFERQVARARRLAPDARAHALREGLAMWRGPPLADLLFEPFAQPEVVLGVRASPVMTAT